ncbi:diguanylate cyclase, partial [Klebsiella pneumoniae]|nr:diguanylate cyclase [Klebsiella pneumoniae]
KSAQIREILISESAWEEMTCLFAPSLAVIVNNSNDELVLTQVNLIQKQINNLSLPSHKDFSCTVSIGISCAKNKASIIEWLKDADEMLYNVKRNGKNGYCMEVNKD